MPYHKLEASWHVYDGQCKVKLLNVSLNKYMQDENFVSVVQIARYSMTACVLGNFRIGFWGKVFDESEYFVCVLGASHVQYSFGAYNILGTGQSKLLSKSTMLLSRNNQQDATL